MTREEVDREILNRIKLRTDFQEKGCWLYRGNADQDGYGRIQFLRKTWRVHRFIFTRIMGCQAEVVRHTCDTLRCWKPTHLLGGTVQDNVRDRVMRDRWNKVCFTDTHCPQGHEWTKDNIYWSKGRTNRTCKICAKSRALKRHYRIRAEMARKSERIRLEHMK